MATIKTRAPFTPEQVASLNGFQSAGVFHEFTCGNDLCPAEQAVLAAAEDGWHCPSCTYTQDWAHDWMADGSWRVLSQVTVTVDDGPPLKGETGTLPPGFMWPGLPEADPRQASSSRWMPTPIVDDMRQLEHDGRTYFLGIRVTAELVGAESAGGPIPVRADLGQRIADMIKADLAAHRPSVAAAKDAQP